MSWISLEIHWEFLELWISMKFDQQAPCYTLLQGKIISSERGSEIWIPTEKGKMDWFHDSLNSKLDF
jgi:hypothetical protein